MDALAELELFLQNFTERATWCCDEDQPANVGLGLGRGQCEQAALVMAEEPNAVRTRFPSNALQRAKDDENDGSCCV